MATTKPDFDDLLRLGTRDEVQAMLERWPTPLALPEAHRLLGPDGPDQLIVTDSILPTRLVPAAGQRAPVILPASGLFAEAVRRMVDGGSVVALRELEISKA